MENKSPCAPADGHSPPVEPTISEAEIPEPQVGPVHAFKEWSLVCRAMALGHQTIILRKGGIAEGRAGFAFRHARFFLFPTRYHAQWERLRPESLARLDSAPDPDDPGNDQDGGEGRGEEPGAEAGEAPVRITLHAEATHRAEITTWESAAALLPFHPWSEDILRERFDYQGDRRLHLAFVRVARLARPWVLPYQRRFGGCRSWLELPPPPASVFPFAPVLEDHAYSRIRETVQSRLAAHGCVLEPWSSD